MQSGSPGSVFVLLEPHEKAHDFNDWRMKAFGKIPRVKDQYILSATDGVERSKGYQYLNVYEVEDIHAIDAELVKGLMEEAKDYIAKSEWQVYQRLQYDQQESLGPRPAGCSVIFVGQTPEEDPKIIADFHKWYVEQHVVHLRKVPGWRTGSRYKLHAHFGDGEEYVAPYAAVHQYEEENGLGGPEWRESVENSWSKKVGTYMVAPNHRRQWKCDK